MALLHRRVKYSADAERQCGRLLIVDEVGDRDEDEERSRRDLDAPAPAMIQWTLDCARISIRNVRGIRRTMARP